MCKCCQLACPECYARFVLESNHRRQHGKGESEMCKCCQLACPECYARIMNPQPPDEPVMCNGCALVRMTDGGLCIDCRIATLTRERDEARREVEELKRQGFTFVRERDEARWKVEQLSDYLLALHHCPGCGESMLDISAYPDEPHKWVCDTKGCDYSEQEFHNAAN